MDKAQCLKEETERLQQEQQEFIRAAMRGLEYAVVGSSRCLAASGMAAAVAAGDAGFFLGVGLVIRAGALAYGSGRVAASLAGQEVTRDLAPAAVRQSQALVAGGLDTGARTLLSDAGGSAVTNTAAAHGGSNLSILDWIPGLATGRAIGAASQSCGG
jgi:hypothetical protein